MLLDTTVCSIALRCVRRSTSDQEAALGDEWYGLVRNARGLLLGVVRQELLSGIREHRQFERLRSELRAFDDVPLESADYERAADYSNICRRAGLQGSSVDFLICSAAVRYDDPILTADRDFEHFVTLLPIRLHTT